MKEPARPDRAPGLDVAMGWLQKSIDQLADVTRRTDALRGPQSVDLAKLTLRPTSHGGRALPRGDRATTTRGPRRPLRPRPTH